MLSTEVTPDISVAPSSADNILYALKVDNQTASSITITQAVIEAKGTHTTSDLFSIDTYYNTVPALTGSPVSLDNQIIANAPNTYTVAFSQAIGAGSIGYLVFAVSVQAGPTSGRTAFVDSDTDPVILTITGSPTQTNSQTDDSGVITIS